MRANGASDGSRGKETAGAREGRPANYCENPVNYCENPESTFSPSRFPVGFALIEMEASPRLETGLRTPARRAARFDARGFVVVFAPKEGSKMRTVKFLRAPVAMAALALVFALALSGCGGVPAAVEQRPNIHGNIHRIVRNGNVAYIFGSMHAGNPDWFPLADVVEAAMRRADVFAFEFDLTQADMLPAPVQYLLLPDGQTLIDFLPHDVYETFIANLSTFDFFDYELMNTLSPLALTQAASSEVMMELGVQAEYSVDFYVLNFAMQNGFPIIGLNSLQSEASIFFSLPDYVQIAVAENFQNKAAAFEAEEEQLIIDMYEAQDLAGFLDLRLAMAEPDDAFSVHFLRYGIHGRCHIFAAEIGRLLTETAEPTTFFITVGLLHIIGGDLDTNVLSLLSGAGFEVVPIF